MIATVNSNALASTGACPAAESGNPPSILVIDDDPLMHALLTNLLDDKGEIRSAMDGRSGIAAARARPPSLIVLDYQMRDMNGLAVCERLKRDPVTAAIPILFLTAWDEEELEVKALEAGAADFLAKPLRPAVVRARVDTQLELLRKSATIRAHAQRDALTNIFNRRYFDECALAEILRHQRHGQALAVALVDVDHFKNYNDALGHPQGDGCLCQIAQALASRMRRPGELVARYGGEEFVVLIPACGAQEAPRYGEWIRCAIEELCIEHPNSAVSGYVTVSVGVVSLIPSRDTTLKIVLALADMGLYAAKKAGRNCHRVLQA